MKRGNWFCMLILLAAFVTGGMQLRKNGDDSISVTVSGGGQASGELLVHFIDVGQADSIFCQLPGGTTMLIDAGNNADGEAVCSYIRSCGADRIDYLVGTHPHEDHIGGMDNVIESFEIGEIYMPRVSANTKTFEDVLDAVADKGLKINEAKRGVSIFNSDGLSAQIISPVRDSYDGLNEYSAVIMLTYGDTKFLFTGDAEAVNEKEITGNIDADVLKVGHHGSDTSSTGEFIKRVSPALAVISVGANNGYKHPSDSVISRLESAGAEVLRTDISGTVTVYSDGNALKYTTKK